ncbi:MAG: 1,4-dihydroxy-2-naphthoate polyprenyltransferase [Propionibacteriales bacterium]|nr:1,4-dihydroxy-2-naphthoate polyprenyltransferase [Propionibacteriales bacterium]
MATTSEWIEGARPRTLPAAVSPVVAATGVAIYAHSAVWWRALLALVVALALQVGVNFANDYSDGVRGTDAERSGPQRLVGSGAASPTRVKNAAFASFGVAAVAGLVLALATAWWLLLVGVAALLAAWFFTGGARPYGYRGLGEVGVFVFFGLVAVIGTTYVQTRHVGAATLWVACGVGALACAILVANNLRDIHSDEAADKRTLAVVLGDRSTRVLFAALHATAFGCLVIAAAASTWWALLGLRSAPLSLHAQAVVRRGATGPALVPVLRVTGLTELVYAVGLFAGLAIGATS